MGFGIVSDDKGTVVYRKDYSTKNGGTFATYCIKASSKDNNDNWHSAFTNIRFKKGVEVNNKSKIKIKSSFPIVSTYKEKSTTDYMIMDFEVLEEGEKPVDPTDTSWMDIPDGIDETLPFQ